MKWDIVYEKAIRDDGSLFFPQRLTQDFLDTAKKKMGSYMFANQYQNEIVPEGEQVFKPQWIKYWTELPKNVNKYAFIDPAISQEDSADFTGIAIVAVDVENNYYVEYAERKKINPTKIVDLCFNIARIYNVKCIGIEDVAYQKALLYMIDTESKRRQVVLPIKGIKPGNDLSKEARIMGLVPRFEWSRIFLRTGMYDLESELLQFPRAAHDDVLDALSQISSIAMPPAKEREKDEQPNISDAENYEKWYRRNAHKRQVDSDGDQSF